MKIETAFAQFSTRASRTEFLHRRFGHQLTPRVLDVGCYEAPLREILGAKDYFGIDIAGNPDREVDLQAAPRLPFEDREFPTVICIEVLEHIDNLHAIFDDLFRVASKRVIVSLPNSWCGARGKLARGRGDIGHYGLPLAPPVDRHKWFFNVTQITGFFRHHEARLGARLIDLVVVEKPRFAGLRALRRLRYSAEAYRNRYAHTVFAVFEVSVPAEP